MDQPAPCLLSSGERSPTDLHAVGAGCRQMEKKHKADRVHERSEVCV